MMIGYIRTNRLIDKMKELMFLKRRQLSMQIEIKFKVDISEIEGD